MTATATKRCLGCDRPVFSAYRGEITVHPPARVERIDASGNVVAVCGACKRRVTWFRSKKLGQASITIG